MSFLRGQMAAPPPSDAKRTRILLLEVMMKHRFRSPGSVRVPNKVLAIGLSLATVAFAADNRLPSETTPAPLKCEVMLAEIGKVSGLPVNAEQDAKEYVTQAARHLGDQFIDAIYGIGEGTDSQSLELIAQNAMQVLGSNPEADDIRFAGTIRELANRSESMQVMMGELAHVHQSLAAIEVETENQGLLGRGASLIRRGVSHLPVLGDRVEAIVVNNKNVVDVFKELRKSIGDKSKQVQDALLANNGDIFRWHEEANFHRMQVAGFGTMAESVEAEMDALAEQDARGNAPQIATFKIFARNLRDHQVVAQDAETMKLSAIDRAIIVGDVLLDARSNLTTKAPRYLDQIAMNVTSGRTLSVAASAQDMTEKLGATAAKTEKTLAQEMKHMVERIIKERDGADWSKVIESAQTMHRETRKMLEDDEIKRDGERAGIIAKNEERLQDLRSRIDPAVYARMKSQGRLTDDSGAPMMTSTFPTIARRGRLTARTGQTPPPQGLPAPSQEPEVIEAEIEPLPVDPPKPVASRSARTRLTARATEIEPPIATPPTTDSVNALVENIDRNIESGVISPEPLRTSEPTARPARPTRPRRLGGRIPRRRPASSFGESDPESGDDGSGS